MPDFMEVAVSVKTPRFSVELSQSDPAAPTAEDQDAQGALLLGTLADAALRYLNHTDAFGQYVAITQLLSGEEPEGRAASGTHVRQVHELLAQISRVTAEHDRARTALAWASDPEHWLVDITHDQVGAVNQVDTNAPPRLDTYQDSTSRHDGATSLPATVLAHATDRLKDRIDDIIDAARSNDLDAVMTVRKVIQDTMAIEVQQATYRTRVRLRAEPGVAFMATAESPALFEADTIRVPRMTSERVVAALTAFEASGGKVAELPPLEARLVSAATSLGDRITFEAGDDEPADVLAVRRLGHLEADPEPLDILFTRLSTGEWEATGADGNGRRYTWAAVAQSALVDCTDEARYGVQHDGSTPPKVRDRLTGERFEVASRAEGHAVVRALHDAALPPVLAARRKAGL